MQLRKRFALHSVVSSFPCHAASQESNGTMLKVCACSLNGIEIKHIGAVLPRAQVLVRLSAPLTALVSVLATHHWKKL
jgi:hypothetical protein